MMEDWISAHIPWRLQFVQHAHAHARLLGRLWALGPDSAAGFLAILTHHVRRMPDEN